MLLPVIVMGVIAAVISIAAGTLLDGTARTVAIIGSIAVWMMLSAKRMLDWFTTGYTITNERVVYRAGVLARQGVEIPLESITNVSFSQSFFERLIRSGDLLIESAGEQGQSRYTDIPDPEGLQSVIYQLREARTVQLRGSSRSVAAEIDALADLRDRGVISSDEFDQQKRRLLGDTPRGDA